LKPAPLGADLFNDKNKLRIKKAASGAHHTLLLSQCGKVFGLGDNQCNQIGRSGVTRKSKAEVDPMRIEKLQPKKATDIFCGNYHSFYLNDKHQVFSWGLNNHG